VFSTCPTICIKQHISYIFAILTLQCLCKKHLDSINSEIKRLKTWDMTKNVQTFKTRNLNTLCLLHTLSVTQHNSLQAAAKTHFPQNTMPCKLRCGWSHISHKPPCPATYSKNTFVTQHNSLHAAVSNMFPT